MTEIYLHVDSKTCNCLITSQEGNPIEIVSEADSKDVNKSELIFIFELLKSLKNCDNAPVMYTSNIYIKNVLSEWIEIWGPENFKFNLVRETEYSEDKQSSIKGYRPNYEILRQIYKLTRKVNIKYKVNCKQYFKK